MPRRPTRHRHRDGEGEGQGEGANWSALSFWAVDRTGIYERTGNAWLEVDLGALRRNAEAVQRCAGAPLIPMVKANAYGVGVLPVVRALEPVAPLAYGVATAGEGCELRRAGIARPVIVFTPVLPPDLAALRDAGLTPALGSAAAIRAWSATGAAYHLAVDTGMNRAGIAWRAVSDLYEVVRVYPPAGVFTHFHSAELDDGSLAVQERRFEEAVAALGLGGVLRHAANSAASVRTPAGRWDAARPGIFLYGVGSGPRAAVQPEPVVHLRARIVELRTVEAGDSVSYDATFIATGRSRIATAAIGYADGYPRAAGNRAQALVHGTAVPVRGVVTMDMTMLDVTDVPAEPGDIVTLIGRDGEVLRTVEEVAAAAAMSPYELLTGLGGRLHREYRDA